MVNDPSITMEITMSQFDSVLRTYADSGLRTADDWMSLGRDIESGAKARLDAPHHGALLPLFSRDQTHARMRSEPKRH
jgi:hypothetical protein